MSSFSVNASIARMLTTSDDSGLTTRHEQRTMNVAALPEVLRWAEPPEDAVARLEWRYAEVLATRLGENVALICQTEPDLGSYLTARIAEMRDDEIRATLLAPETSRRLVTRLHEFRDVKDHLRRSLDAIQPATADASSSRLGGTIPVTLEPSDDPRLAEILNHAERALMLISQGCRPAAAFVKRVTRRLVLRVDDARGGFTSNSPQGFVGQAILTNAHLSMVDDVVVAEALVHESIHGFVGMSEAIGLAGHRADEQWVANERVYEGYSCTVSPWTGKALDLPTYLHACFVWWGLLNLWASLAGQRVFDERRLRNRLARAARGFLDGALLLQLRPHRNIVNPQLLSTLETMSAEVGALLTETGLNELLGRIKPIANAQ